MVYLIVFVYVVGDGISDCICSFLFVKFAIHLCLRRPLAKGKYTVLSPNNIGISKFIYQCYRGWYI